MEVFGYFCVGVNNKWKEEHHGLCYQMDELQIPFTSQYIDCLFFSIEDVIKISDIDDIKFEFFVTWKLELSIGWVIYNYAKR